MKDFKEMIRSLEKVPEWIILAHEKPDGDTLGCGSALFLKGMALGKKCSWFGPDPFPRVYGFLPFSEKYVTTETLEGMTGYGEMAVVVTDTSNPGRTVGGLTQVGDRVAVINIDHHGDNSRFGTFNWVDEEASSVGLMI